LHFEDVMPTKDASANPTQDQTSYELCLMRHGIALALGSEGFADDAKRPLTSLGKKKMKDIATGLSRLFVPDWIVTSPLVRAAETAGVVHESQGAKVAMEFCEALRPGGSLDGFLGFLAKHPERRHILAVGHEPDLSDIAARLIGTGRHANLAFKKGGCCLISFNELPPRSSGRLVWWLTPRVLRKLA